MENRKRLIVNADDFGASTGVNRGVIETFERGIVTSASLMVRWPAAAEAAEYARNNPDLSVGLHFDLYEMFCKDWEWKPLYQVVDAKDAEAVFDELMSQLSMFRTLMAREPTHVDSHQHAHRDEPVRSLLLDVGSTLGVPIRHFDETIRYDGRFYGQTRHGDPYPQAITREYLIEILSALPAGVTELGCHPGYDDLESSMYVVERVDEVNVLCDPAVLATIESEGIELISFNDL